MSYAAEICFKTVPAKDVFKFFQDLKNECRAKFKEIAKESFIYLPSTTSQYRDMDEYNQECANRNWMRSNIFTFRYFYLPELELLGMFSIPESVHYLFDKAIYFQNSSDQDYDWDTWEGIEDFEAIAYKWQNVSDEIVFNRYVETYSGNESDRVDFDYQYYRKTFCYDEIWDKIDRFLYQESLIVYLSLFGGYELHEATIFCKYCSDYYKEWRASLDKRCMDAASKIDELEEIKAEI